MSEPEHIARASRIIDAIAEGSSLRTALKAERMSWQKFSDLCDAYPILSSRVARAEELRADIISDEMIDIADGTGDTQQARNRIDVRKWLAARLRPKKYGDKIDIGVSGSIDLMAVVREARNRLPVQDAQVIDYTPIPLIGHTDSVSVPSEPSATDDIFS